MASFSTRQRLHLYRAKTRQCATRVGIRKCVKGQPTSKDKLFSKHFVWCVDQLSILRFSICNHVFSKSAAESLISQFVNQFVNWFCTLVFLASFGENKHVFCLCLAHGRTAARTLSIPTMIVLVYRRQRVHPHRSRQVARNARFPCHKVLTTGMLVRATRRGRGWVRRKKDCR